MSEITPAFPNGLLSSVEAGRRFGYTKDYVAKLAREGKITATRIGRQWFVEESSLNDFITKAEQAKREHAERIRQERKVELSASVGERAVVAHQTRAIVVRPRALALIESGVIMILGVLLGSFLFSLEGARHAGTFSFEAPVDALSRLAGQTYGALGGLDKEGVEEDSESNSISPSPSREALIIAPIESEKAEDIATSFSDEVDVTFDEDGKSGVITPTFKEANDPYAYRFMLVPMKDP